MSLRTQGQFLLIGALGLIVANILAVVIPGPLGPSGPASVPANVVAIGASVVDCIGLPALVRLLGERGGVAARLAVTLLALGTVVVFVVISGAQIRADLSHAGSAAETVHGPPIYVVIGVLIGAVCYVVGGLIYGVLALRARTLPAGVGWLSIIAAVLLIPSFVVFPNGSLASSIASSAVVSILYAAWAWASASALGARQAQSVGAR